VPLDAGRFDLDDYIDYLIGFWNISARQPGGTHMLAVCQPSVPAYAATAVMGAANNPGAR
jgi:poly(3-hydroxybutyrate) depolymerase